MLNKHDPMQMFRSAKTAKVVHKLEDKPKRTNRETPLQSSITKWLKLQYPGIIFFSDFAAGLKLTPSQANVRSIQACQDKYLDLTIMKPSGRYHGLVLELKVSNNDLFLKDNITLKSDHVREQYHTILKLRSEGYCADFAVGFDDCAACISTYINTGQMNYKHIIKSR